MAASAQDLENPYDISIIDSQLKPIAETARMALLDADAAAFAGVLQRVDDLEDAHYQMWVDQEIWSSLIRSHRDNIHAWPGLFLAFAEHLYGRLRQNPLEPVLWNFLGVALFELGQDRAAERCFKIVLELENDYETASNNLAQVRKRRQRGNVQLPFAYQVLQGAKQLAGSVSTFGKSVALPQPTDMKLSLVMIVKNEEAALPRCLDSVQGLVDEMIVVDTGSTDRTVEIAKQYGAQVIDFPWTGSFSEARNVSLEHATGDWVLQLDADECLIPEQHTELRSKLSRVYREGFNLVEHNYSGDGSIHDHVMSVSTMRLWRNRPQYRFSGVIHEQKGNTMPIWVSERTEDTQLNILHFGYLKEVRHSKNKSQRNLELLLQEAESNPSPFNRFNLGSEYAAAGDAATALEYFESSWDELQASGKLLQAGYSPMLAIRRTSAAIASGDPAKAIRYADQGLEVFPASTMLVLEKAHAYEAIGDLDAAIRYARQALDMPEPSAKLGGLAGSGTFLARAFLGLMLERQGNSSDAIQVYKDSLDQDPQYLPNLGSLVRAMVMSGQPAAEVLAAVQPYMQDDLRAAGSIVAARLFERDEAEAALEVYNQIEASQMQDPVVQVGLVECLLSLGRLEEALQECQPLQADNPASGALLRAALFCCILLGDLDQAEALLSRSFELNLDQSEYAVISSWLQALQDQGLQMWNTDQCLAASPMLESALKLQEFDAAQALIRLYYNASISVADRTMILAPIYTRQGYLDSAAECWLEWIDQEGPRADSLVGLAYISRAEGRHEEALALAEDAVSLDGSHREALRMVQAFA